MLELFPQGFEEIEHADGLELVAYTDDAGEERLWAALRRGARRRRGRRTGRSAGATSTGRSRVGPLWIGPPWEEPPDGVDRGRDRSRRAFGTGAHATTRLCLELLDGLERGSLLDVGCGSGVLAIAAAKLGFAPVLAVDHDPAAVEATRARTPRRTASSVEAPAASTRSASRCRRRTSRSRTSRSRASSSSSPRLDARTLVTSGYLERDAPGAAGFRRERRVAEARLGGGSCFGARSKVPRRGDVLGPLPRLQGLARRRAGDPRAPARGRPRGARRRRRRRRRQHLLRHARGGAQVAPRRRAGRAHAPARLRHRLRREPRRRRASPACPRTSSSSRGRARRRRRSSRATSARSAASRPTRGSTASARS